MSVNLVTLGMFYSFPVFGWVPWLASRVNPDDGGRDDVPGDHVCRAGRGHAPRRGRLHLAEAGSSTGSGRRRGAVILGVGVLWWAGALALGHVALVPGIAGAVVGGCSALRGGIGFVLSATGWWFILALWAPIYGAILNVEFVQPLAALAGIKDGRASWAGKAACSSSRSSSSPGPGLVALGMAGYAASSA